VGLVWIFFGRKEIQKTPPPKQKMTTEASWPTKHSIASLLHAKPTTSLWQDTMREHVASVSHATVYDDALRCKPLPATVDVCIVGSGMSGTSLAYWFAMNQNSKET
jgi:hypothetical protein